MRAIEEKHLAILRRHMVDVIGIHADLSSDEIGKSELDERVLAVMREVPRHFFVPPQVTSAAYHDMPLPIGFNKTISQPFMVALMTDLLAVSPSDRVLEVEPGSDTKPPSSPTWPHTSGAWRSSKSLPRRQSLVSSNLGSKTLRSVSATGPGAGQSTHRTTRSWWPQRLPTHRLPCSDSLKKVVAWSCRLGRGKRSGFPFWKRAPRGSSVGSLWLFNSAN
jgi:Protein-L-isoaspartate(D-aspartate) O-methyltransferase (PCMT)